MASKIRHGTLTRASSSQTVRCEEKSSSSFACARSRQGSYGLCLDTDVFLYSSLFSLARKIILFKRQQSQVGHAKQVRSVRTSQLQRRQTS